MTIVCHGTSPAPDGHATLCQALKGTCFRCLCPVRTQIIMMCFEDICVSRHCLHIFSYNYRFVIRYLMTTPPLMINIFLHNST